MDKMMKGILAMAEMQREAQLESAREAEYRARSAFREYESEESYEEWQEALCNLRDLQEREERLLFGEDYYEEE